ncbi:MAG: hypothetical protein L3J50_12060 [Emcibacter sp.]|nr:hypothetical protein [Emcibacter sp.]
MRMHQNGMDFDLPRKGVPIVAEIDPAKLQKYLGSYRSKIFEGNVEVIIQNHRLSLDIPNQMVIELHLPGADGRRHARIRPKMSIDFDHDEKGQITAFNVYRDGEKIDSAHRAAEITSALPTLEDIMALRQTERRKTALLKSGGFRFIGKIIMVQAGISGKVMTNFEGTDRYRLDINLGKYGTIHTASNGERAASMGIQPYTEHKGKYLEQMQKDHPAVDVDWRDYYDSIDVTGVSELKDKKVYVLKLKGGKTPSVTLYIDADTGDVLKRKSRILVPGVGKLRVTVNYEDYREIYGLRMPFKVTSRNKMNGTTIIEFETAEANLKFKPEFFILNKPK